MSAVTQVEKQETNVQERPIAAPSDNSLPAAQALEAQHNSIAESNPAPRFIP